MRGGDFNRLTINVKSAERKKFVRENCFCEPRPEKKELNQTYLINFGFGLKAIARA